MAPKGDRVSTVGSSHRPALSRPAQRLAPCVRPGLGEKGYIIGPWPMTFPCSVPTFSPQGNVRDGEFSFC